MSKCFIFYVSQHHQNTEKLLKQAIGGDPLAELVPLTDAPLPDLSQYSLIGLASGVYMGEPHTAILAFLEKHRKDRSCTLFMMWVKKSMTALQRFSGRESGKAYSPPTSISCPPPLPSGPHWEA